MSAENDTTTTPVAATADERFVSHAQNFEDVMLWRALHGVGRGRYLDVGAAEPEADSVTFAFYERGWRGINVEPLAGPFSRLRTARPQDVNLNVAVGTSPREAPLFVVGNENGLSTLDPALAEQHRSDGWEVSERRVPVMTLAEICAAHVEGDLHFLKLDAEGAELDILRSGDFARWRPWIILFEARDPRLHRPVHEPLEREVLTPAGYMFVYDDGLNRFYVAAEREAALRPAFQTPPNVFDNFIRASEARALEQAPPGGVSYTDMQRMLHVAQERADEAQSRVNSAQTAVEEEQGRVAAAEARADHAQGIAMAAEARADHAQSVAHAAQLRTDAMSAQAHAAEERAAAAEAARDGAEAGHAALAARQQQLLTDLTRTSQERDTWAQELFEANRHAAELVVARQDLAQELAGLRNHERWRVAEATLHGHREAEMRGEIESLRAGNAALRSDNAALRANIAVWRQDWARLSERAEQNERWLAAVRRSTSWRMTRPMRAALRLLGRRG